jgi:hypothetical protein
MMVADTPEKIEAWRLITLYHALSLEIKTGMKRSSRGRATGTLVREATGLRMRNKAKLLTAFDMWLKQRGLRECEHNIIEAGIGHDPVTGENAGPVGLCDRCDSWLKGRFIEDGDGNWIGFEVGRN